MILIDASSGFHKSVFKTINILKKEEEKEFYDILEHKNLFYKVLLENYFSYIEKFKQFGEVIFCLDDKSETPNWRKEIYPMYKHQRSKNREVVTQFNYADAFILYNKFLENLPLLGYKVVSTPGTEADDEILVLSEYAGNNKIPTIILSPDKDFIQSQRLPGIQQYDWIRSRYVTFDDKNESMELWLAEHVALGDIADNVPKITDFQEFNPGVKEFLIKQGLNESITPFEFSSHRYNPDDFTEFGGVFKKERFGAKRLAKVVEEYGSLEAYAQSNPIIYQNYLRNKQLVLQEGIPNKIKDQILEDYKQSPNFTDIKKFVAELELELSDLPDTLQQKYLAYDMLAGFTL